jgi:hypothetical protein
MLIWIIREGFVVMCASVDHQRNYMVMCADVAHRSRIYGDIC